MASALIASATDKGRKLFEELLKTEDFSLILTGKSGKEIRDCLKYNSYDLILINAPLPDEFGHQLALDVVENTASGVILVAKQEHLDQYCKKAEESGIFTVPKPMNREFFLKAVRLVLAFRRRILGITKENVKLQNKIEEIRLVDRAKCTLIQYLSMSESQAHRYMEKQAMDLRITKREVAEGILKTYEN